MPKIKKVTHENLLACKIPRKEQAIQALFGLAWRKEKKYRPQWLIRELEIYN